MAVGLAAEIKESSELEARLIVGEKGIFDVTLGTDLLFSKHATNRFPFLGEISEILRDEKYCMKNG